MVKLTDYISTTEMWFGTYESFYQYQCLSMFDNNIFGVSNKYVLLQTEETWRK